MDKDRDDVRNNIIEKCQEYRYANIWDISIKTADAVYHRFRFPDSEYFPVYYEQYEKCGQFKNDQRKRKP